MNEGMNSQGPFGNWLRQGTISRARAEASRRRALWLGIGVMLAGVAVILYAMVQLWP